MPGCRRHPSPLNTLDRSTLHHQLSSTRLISPQPASSTHLSHARHSQHQQIAPVDFMTTDIQNLKSFDPFAEADDAGGEVKSTQQNYIHIRIQQRNGRKTLTTVQGLPKKFDQKKILKVIKKKFACNGTVVADSEMGEVIQMQGDQRKDVQDFLTDKKEGLGLDGKTIKVHGF
ncbi:protein translation factor sui1 [Stemphylium lycopersici]|uniref:Protein translation factor sui1 n=1 Tax=Stemphylium lycopersici TaxID=183478 RepID=A0A364N6A7_STELY|nr:protein translation factor sui1 [Stemphylium lycopersici]RAR04652.1 protein translation factor sui1 [Stemphylium lycopersici]RAR12796.1 protein translation factor sui1 [Stemphylium lycopersici]